MGRQNPIVRSRGTRVEEVDSAGARYRQDDAGELTIPVKARPLPAPEKNQQNDQSHSEAEMGEDVRHIEKRRRLETVEVPRIQSE